jgi:hypothetical protein
MSLTGIPSKDDLLALEDHGAADITSVLQPILLRIDALNTNLDRICTIVERFNLSPPKTP